jgi:2-keto-4-pentenoate hydratase/2-oxohepta-3-ene-1,7-dioic acid hydratase in catechol pathway
MKLATYGYEGGRSFGVVLDEGMCDVPSLWPGAPGSVVEALQGGPDLLREIAQRAAGGSALLPPGDAALLAPIPEPPKLIGLAVNYAAHHREFDRDGELPGSAKRRTTPRPFLMPATAVVGPGAEIPWPAYSRDVDYEVELAAVVGSPARCVSPAEARECLAGYTIANDISARTVTCAEGRRARPKDDFFDWLHGKWSDGFCPLGPYLVTADEIGDPHDLRMQCLVNGEVRQDACTGEMIHDVHEVVSFLSHVMTLLPGDVIATGTPSGVGMATGRLLAGGDVITCRIDKIGELTNTLGPPPQRFYAPCA